MSQYSYRGSTDNSESHHSPLINYRKDAKKVLNSHSWLLVKVVLVRPHLLTVC